MNRTIAIMKKQFKDTLKNMLTLVQFVMFPALAFIFTEFVAKPSDFLQDNYFVILFATMYVGYVPLVNMTNVISEEREKKSLRMLIMSNVKPVEYLIGVGGYVMLLCTLGNVAFGLIGRYSGAELLRFVLVTFIGALASLLLGAAVGIFSNNQSAAHALSVPLAIVAAFLPMVAMFNENIAKIANVLYTQQISSMVNDISAANFTPDRFIIIGLNILIFLSAFIFVFRKADLME